MPTRIVETVPARAALAGNPSDGYGGAVLAVPVRAVSARVTAHPASDLTIGGVPLPPLPLDPGAGAVGSDPDRDDRDDHPDRGDRDAGDGVALLVAAAVRAYADALGRPPPCALEVETTIPRSVGLAGSSAIVVGVLRALARVAGRSPLPPDELAALALAAEVDHLGIAAGLQDRLVQAHDAALHMEFGDGRGHRRVSPAHPVALVVAARPGAAAPSGATHGPLRARWARGDPEVGVAMAALAETARDATAALERADAVALAAAVDRSFDLRRSLLDLDPAHVELVDATRAAGAAANFSGSGGSVTVVAADDGVVGRARSALTGLGCVLYDVTLS